MNFLNEVLQSAEETDITTLKKRLPTLSLQISSCKQEVLKFIDDVYYKFCDWPKHNAKLLDVSTQLSTELQDLQHKIEQVTVKQIEKSNVEIHSLSEELDRSNSTLYIINGIIQIHETLILVKDLQKQKSVIKAAHALITLHDVINNLPDDEVSGALIILKENVMVEKANILMALQDMFDVAIKVHSRVAINIQTNSIKIKKKTDNFAELLQTLDLFNGHPETLDRIGKFILEICKGIINNIATIKLHDEGNYHVLTVAIKKTIARGQHHEVFSKLTEIFAFLYSYFDYSIGKDVTIMRYIGKTFEAQLAKVLIKDFFDKVKPTCDAEFAKYEVLLKDIIKFQAKLVEFNIFESDNQILDYAKKMDELLIEQKCNEYLGDAIALMKKDLHDSIEVGDKSGEGNVLMPEQFPQSVVSRSVIEILELLRVLLDEAQASSDICAARLICTAQSIFYQYGNIVHGHHERLLLTIPQQVALFRNNCLYIAHNLVKFNEEYSNKFTTAALPSPPLFTDQGHQLRTIGGEIFLGYIDDQVRLMEMMLETHLTSSHVADTLTPDLEKLLRQCLRQYELLKTVWIKILPSSVFNKSLGYLFNAFCKKLITTVVSASDIPSTNAENLVETFKIVITRGPKLFSNTQEVSLHVEMWPKLNDLVFILSASLVNINDMWADGKGPLTLTFTAEEIRSLIKALFQNTDRRAVVLSKIH